MGKLFASAESTEEQSGRLATFFLATCQFVTLASLAAWPWFLGGVIPESFLALSVVSGIVLVTYLVAVFVSGAMRTPVTVWIVIAAMGLAALQMAPLPMSVLRTVAPKSAEVWTNFSAKGEDEPVKSRTISISPEDTEHDLTQLWVAAVFVLAGSALSVSRRSTIALLMVLTVNGALLAIFGVVQRLTWNGGLYWIIESPTTRVFGPYVNHNNAGGYLLICLSAAIGLLAWRMIGRVAPSSVSTLTRRAGTANQIADRISWIRLTAITVLNDFRFLLVALSLVLIAAAIVVTLSRGAFLGMLAAGCCSALLLSRKGYRGALALSLVLAILTLVCVGWILNLGVVKDRLQTLLDPAELQSARVLHLQDALSMIPDYWFSGCGIGSYRYANGMYRSSPYEGAFHYVENQFVESFVVAGILGVALLALGMCLAALSTWKLARNENAWQWSVAVFSAALLGSQLVAATFDFGWYMPANMIALAAAVGLIEALSRRGATGSRWTAIGAALLLVGIGFYAIPESRKIMTAQRAVWNVEDRFGEELGGPSASADEIRSEIATLERALSHRPNDTEALGLLANKQIRFARALVHDKLQSENGNGTDKALWEISSLHYLNMTAHQLLRRGDQTALDAFRSREELQPLVVANERFEQLLESCPLLYRAHYARSQLALLVRGEAATWRREMAKAFALLPQDADLRWRMGVMESFAGDHERGCELIRDSIKLAGESNRQMISYACQVLTPQQLAVDAIPQDPIQMLEIAQRFLQSPARKEFRVAVASTADELLASADLPEFDRMVLSAKAQGLMERYEEAEGLFSRVLQQLPGYAPALFEYGRMLERLGRVKEATSMFEDCVKDDPESAKYAEALIRIQKRTARLNSTN